MFSTDFIIARLKKALMSPNNLINIDLVERVHMHVLRLMKTESIGSRSYYLVIIDAYKSLFFSLAFKCKTEKCLRSWAYISKDACKWHDIYQRISFWNTLGNIIQSLSQSLNESKKWNSRFILVISTDRWERWMSCSKYFSTCSRAGNNFPNLIGPRQCNKTYGFVAQKVQCTPNNDYLLDFWGSKGNIWKISFSKANMFIYLRPTYRSNQRNAEKW